MAEVTAPFFNIYGTELTLADEIVFNINSLNSTIGNGTTIGFADNAASKKLTINASDTGWELDRVSIQWGAAHFAGQRGEAECQSAVCR